VPDAGGIACQDLDQHTNLRSRSRIEGPLTPRAIDNPSGIAQPGDQIAFLSGRQLVLRGLAFTAPALGAAVPTLVGDFFTDLVPSLGTAIGTTGLNFHPAITCLSPWRVMTIFDAGINGGAGVVDAN
jgi:hypothetical protein